jgi:hypothetical protein
MGMRAPRRRGRPHPAGRRLGGFLLAALLALTTVTCGGPVNEPAAEPTPAPATVEVEVFFVNHRLGDRCTDVFPVSRSVAADDPVHGALAALLGGPTDLERIDGYGGPFSADTVDALLAVEVSGGVAAVTFDDSIRDAIPAAATSSCTADRVVAQLDRTLLALEGITATRYLLADGPAFDAWLGLPDPDALGPAEETEPPEGPATDATEPPEGPATDGTEPADTDPSEPAPSPGDEPADATEPEPEDAEPEAGWSSQVYGWPVAPGCCGAPTTGPTSPAGRLPPNGWPADGFYAVEVARTAADTSTLELTVRRWLPSEEPIEMWEGIEDVIVPDPDEAIERQVGIADLTVVLLPIHPFGAEETRALVGEPGALARLLGDGIDTAYRRWVFEPAMGGASVAAIEQDLLTRSSDPAFPFGQDHQPDATADTPFAYRGPAGSSLLADPSWLEPTTAWPPGLNGLYSWHGLTLELRAGDPVLHLWAGQIAG